MGIGKFVFGFDFVELFVVEGQSVEIVNVDVMQLYWGMDIGMVKLFFGVWCGILYYLFDVFDLCDEVSVVSYQVDVCVVIDGILSWGVILILVGGSGFYVVSVFYDFQFFGYNVEIWVELEVEFMDYGFGILYQWLWGFDFVVVGVIGFYNGCWLV